MRDTQNNKLAYLKQHSPSNKLLAWNAIRLEAAFSVSGPYELESDVESLEK